MKKSTYHPSLRKSDRSEPIQPIYADGTRNFKLTSPRISMSQTAFTFNTVQSVPPLVYPTLYASPLITLTKHGYTKHYFEGMNRICSKLGGGFDAGLLVEIEDTVPALACDYVQQSKRQNEGVNRTFADCLGMGAEVDGKYDLYKVVIRETERDEKEPAFYYHSDHLGSAAYLTNDDGKVTQALNYLPYGEDWVDVRYDLDPRLGQYTFNGKEKDHESGFHYYGARYYWSELLTGWLSVDPMIDKYPNISSYAYCAWNPIKAIDPNGMDSVHTPNGMANVGTGYKATDNGQFLYGEGLKTKRWNPDLEIGGVVGDGLRGGYEDWSPSSDISVSVPGAACSDANIESSMPPQLPFMAGVYDALGSRNFAENVAIRGDGTLMYANNEGFGKGLSWRNGKVFKNTSFGKIAHKTSSRIPALSIVTGVADVGINSMQYGFESRQTYGAIGGAFCGILASMGTGTLMGGPVGAVVGLAVGIGASYGGEYLGKKTFDLKHK